MNYSLSLLGKTMFGLQNQGMLKSTKDRLDRQAQRDGKIEFRHGRSAVTLVQIHAHGGGRAGGPFSRKVKPAFQPLLSVQPVIHSYLKTLGHVFLHCQAAILIYDADIIQAAGLSDADRRYRNFLCKSGAGPDALHSVKQEFPVHTQSVLSVHKHRHQVDHSLRQL